MRLGQLLRGMAIRDFRGDGEIEIEGLAYDSRAVKSGYLFVALRGQTLDGHDFIGKAVEKGAMAVVAEKFDRIDHGIATVLVQDSRVALSKLSVRFFDRPFKDMGLVGITGTNGKTTTSYLLESILLAAGARPGVIGTINYRFCGQTREAPMTTPESLDLMRTLREMADAGVTDVVMEVSSHALDQGRARECPFRIAIFTNISRDHLDYHHTMEEYFEVKSRLFRDLGEGNDLTKAVVNADDPKGKDLAELTHVPVVTYGLGRDCKVRADRVQMSRSGLSARLITPAGEVDIQSSLLGNFNIYNILAASTAALCMDIDLNAVSEGIGGLKRIPGRLELVGNSRSLAVVVDYAHTPDALLNALGAVRPLTKGRLITVFGCGGDRDKGKRREMGRIAGGYSDLVFITSDNPRSENPAAIAYEIEKGVCESGLEQLVELSGDRRAQSGYILDLDRGSAIQRAVGIAGESDLILIAGKGHEDYQIIGKYRRHFDDREVAAEAASGEI